MRFRVKSLTQDLTGTTAKLTTFRYDAQGRLSSLFAYRTPDSTQGPVERCTYQYDSQNRLIQQQRQVRTNLSLANAAVVLYTPSVSQHQFSYTANGQVAQIRYYENPYFLTSGQTVVELSVLNSSNALTFVLDARYDTKGQLIGARKVFYKQGQQSSSTYTSEYRYTEANLTYMRTINMFNGVEYAPDENSLTYDDQINPFYGVYVIPPYFGGISDYFLNLNTLSPNNITQVGGVSYRYEYNESKLPTVRYTISDNKVVETLHFTYEAY